MDLTNYANYHEWAGDKIRAILKTLTEEEFTRDLGDFFSYNTIRDICQHMLLALEFGTSLASNIEPDVFNAEVEKIVKMTDEELIDRWKKTDHKYAQMLQGDISGQVVVPPFLGHEFTLEKYDFLLQYITHTTFHRGQIIIALKKLGKEVKGTNYLHYLYEIRSQK